jgi:hypothetical protein
MRPISEFLVPRQKLGVFAQLALQEMNQMGWGAAVEDVRAGMARAADATEDRMGQMTYDNLFYNKAMKDVSLLGFRAYGWQLGKYRHLYGAASDAAKLAYGAGEKAVSAARGVPSKTEPMQVTNRMLYPVALTMVAATVGAIVHRLCTGTESANVAGLLFSAERTEGQPGEAAAIDVADVHEGPDFGLEGFSQPEENGREFLSQVESVDCGDCGYAPEPGLLRGGDSASG